MKRQAVICSYKTFAIFEAIISSFMEAILMVAVVFHFLLFFRPFSFISFDSLVPSLCLTLSLSPAQIFLPFLVPYLTCLIFNSSVSSLRLSLFL